MLQKFWLGSASIKNFSYFSQVAFSHSSDFFVWKRTFEIKKRLCWKVWMRRKKGKPDNPPHPPVRLVPSPPSPRWWSWESSQTGGRRRRREPTTETGERRRPRLERVSEREILSGEKQFSFVDEFCRDKAENCLRNNSGKRYFRHFRFLPLTLALD